ncbi:MAG TPA: prepilin-type N-terminal cleavage/methylation domain-containing protein [Longimicrobium sp.]|jgi:hypothetical protein
MSHRSAGFTLIEILGVLVVTAVIATGVWSVAESVTRGQVQAMNDGDRASAVASIDGVLRNALRQATLGTLAAPNAGPVQVLVAGSGAASSDTLLVLRAEYAPITNSTRPCPGGGACLLLVGDHSGVIGEGEVLLVSAPAMGARVYRVTGEPHANHAACGADCEEEVVCPTYTDETAEQVTVVSGGTYTRSSPPVDPTPVTACRQTYYEDGGVCTERRERVNAPRPKRTWDCRARGRVSAYTEVPVAELTAALGFPDVGSPTQSGASLTPRVRTQRVTASRFFVRRDGTRGAPVLVRQTGLDDGGAWSAAVPIGGPVATLEVETLHTGETAWRRGVGVGAAALGHSTGNPNYAYTVFPTATAEPGFSFRRGYHDVGAVRIRFTVPTEQADGTVHNVPYVTVVATNGGTRNGSEGGW